METEKRDCPKCGKPMSVWELRMNLQWAQMPPPFCYECTKCDFKCSEKDFYLLQRSNND